MSEADSSASDDDDFNTGFDISGWVALARRNGLWLMLAMLLGGSAGYGISFAFKPRFLSATSFIAPQQSGGAGAALAQQFGLGALGGLVGSSTRSSGDQYVAFLQSVTVSDNIIRKFDLMKVYDTETMQDTRKRLAKRAQVVLGKKDGLVRIDVEDTDPQRAAAMANHYVEELRVLTGRLAVTEAQQRRLFFEQRLAETKAKLTAAQVALESSGLNAGALKAEPRSAAEGYARLRAELTAARVKLQVLRGNLADTSSEVVNQLAAVQALASQVALLETAQSSQSGNADYVSRYREFKYQETLFDMFAKQYELARVDESKEGALIQVLDQAMPAEKKVFPGRGLFTAVAALLALIMAFAIVHRRQRPEPPLLA